GAMGPDCRSRPDALPICAPGTRGGDGWRRRDAQAAGARGPPARPSEMGRPRAADQRFREGPQRFAQLSTTRAEEHGMKTYQQLFVLGSVLVAACSGERAASSDAGAGGDAIDVGGSLLQAELNRPDLVVPLSSMVFHDECTETRGDACDSCE